MTGNCELHPGALGRYWGVYVLLKQIKLLYQAASDTYRKLIQNKQIKDAWCSGFVEKS